MPRRLLKMMKRQGRRGFVGGMIGAALCGACARGGADGAAAEGRDDLAGALTITGSSTVAPLIGEMAKRFEVAHPGARISVQTGGSSRGVADARQGVADLGMVSRALRDDERDLEGFTVARDGLCMIVHRNNPIPGLSDEQVVGIYTGRIARWSAVGGQDAPITVVGKAEGRSTYELFMQHFRLKAEEVRTQVIIGDNEQGIKTVAGSPGAIGYVSIGAAEHSASHGSAIRLLPISGVAPSVASVKSGAFPLVRPLLLVSKGSPRGLARAFVEFAMSPGNHDLIQEQSFVPIGE